MANPTHPEPDLDILTCGGEHFGKRKEGDEITVAKSIFDEIVEFSEDTPKQKRARKAGRARAEKLTAKERSEIAKKAAQTRWKAAAK